MKTKKIELFEKQQLLMQPRGVETTSLVHLGLPWKLAAFYCFTYSSHFLLSIHAFFVRNPPEGTRVKSRGNEFWPYLGNEFWPVENEICCSGNEFQPFWLKIWPILWLFCTFCVSVWCKWYKNRWNLPKSDFLGPWKWVLLLRKWVSPFRKWV